MKKRVVISTMLLLVLLLSGCPGKGTISTGEGSISGNVVIPNQTDHSGIKVSLGNSAVVTTTANGAFSFQNLSDGEYTLTFAKTGYLTSQKVVQIVDEDSVQLEPIRLQVDPAGNPQFGYVQGHGTYFDFETGQMTDDFVNGDLRLNAFTIYGGKYQIHIDEVIGQIFAETYPDGYLSFHQFRDVTLDDVQFPTEKTVIQSPYIGDVVVLKTNQDKVVKLIILEKIYDYFESDAPMLKFLYLYDHFVDTTIPTLQEVTLITEDGNEHSQIPSGGELVFTVASKPVELRYQFNEYIKADSQSYYLNDSLQLFFEYVNYNIPYFDSVKTALYGISTPGDYTIRLNEDADYYFEDLSGNQIVEKPFTQMTIHYTE